MSSARRGSLAPGSKKSGGTDLSKRRQSSSLTSPSPFKSEVQPIREGDVFYRTEKVFPSISDAEEDITWTVVKPFDPNSPLPATSRRDGSASKNDRRGSNHPTIREETHLSEDYTPRDLRFGCIFRLVYLNIVNGDFILE